jgi:hypothetical protein
MRGSPITSWEDAEAVFTFADNPTLLGIFLILAILLCIGTIIGTIVHESKSFRR